MPDHEPFHFAGFVNPNTTPVPDDLFDVLMAQLSEAELKVLLYVIRRTFGFKKNADAISFSQMTDGIKRRDGSILDSGTGMSKSSVWRGVNGLLAKGVLIKTTQTTDEGDSGTNVFSLRFQEGVVSNQNNPSTKLKPPVVPQQNTQDSSTQDKDLERYKRYATPDIEHMFDGSEK